MHQMCFLKCEWGHSGQAVASSFTPNEWSEMGNENLLTGGKAPHRLDCSCWRQPSKLSCLVSDLEAPPESSPETRLLWEILGGAEGQEQTSQLLDSAPQCRNAPHSFFEVLHHEQSASGVSAVWWRFHLLLSLNSLFHKMYYVDHYLPGNGIFGKSCILIWNTSQP